MLHRCMLLVVVYIALTVSPVVGDVESIPAVKDCAAVVLPGEDGRKAAI